jgi:hypothetical protein
MGNILPKGDRPRFGKGQAIGLPGLVLSYVISWYCYVLTASNDSVTCPADSSGGGKCTPWYKPTVSQWFGLLVTSVIATLAFLTFFLNVQGSPTNLEENQKPQATPYSKLGIGAHLKRASS